MSEKQKLPIWSGTWIFAAAVVTLLLLASGYAIGSKGDPPEWMLMAVGLCASVGTISQIAYEAGYRAAQKGTP